MTNIILTGGCGFIGFHFIFHVMKNTDWNIIIIDKLSYASLGLKRLKDPDLDMYKDRIKLFTWDLCNPISEGLEIEIGNDIQYIIHMAAETHVNNSINEPSYVIKNNIMSTVNILEFSRKIKNLEKFVYFSTDEVYGPALNGKLFKENERHNPTNPYSASKSGAEKICISYHNSFQLPLIVVNVMNAFGEMQHIEKFIPLCVKKILNNEEINIHCYPDMKKSGTRFYIHGRNIACGVIFLLDKGIIGENYNLTGEKEISNLDLAKFIAKILNKELKYKLICDDSDRPNHDLRYGLDGTKLNELGWKLPLNFEDSLKNTIIWISKNLNFYE